MIYPVNRTQFEPKFNYCMFMKNGALLPQCAKVVTNYINYLARNVMATKFECFINLEIFYQYFTEKWRL